MSNPFITTAHLRVPPLFTTHWTFTATGPRLYTSGATIPPEHITLGLTEKDLHLERCAVVLQVWSKDSEGAARTLFSEDLTGALRREEMIKQITDRALKTRSLWSELRSFTEEDLIVFCKALHYLEQGGQYKTFEGLSVFIGTGVFITP